MIPVDDGGVIVIIDSVKIFLYETEELTFSNIQSYIAAKKTYALQNIEGRDLDIVITYLCAVERSCYFWMPTNDGGSGVGADFIDDLVGKNQVNWKQIAIADGAGAAGVLLRTWYLAAFGPLSWSAILGAICWGAAWASGTALLYQLL